MMITAFFGAVIILLVTLDDTYSDEPYELARSIIFSTFVSSHYIIHALRNAAIELSLNTVQSLPCLFFGSLTIRIFATMIVVIPTARGMENKRCSP